MQKGDYMRTPTGKTGRIVGLWRMDHPGGERRVQLAIICAIDGKDPVWIRAAYDPRDLTPAAPRP